MELWRILKKNPEKPITILTCYDYPTARALDTSDIDMVFVGDSVGTTMLGYRSVLEVTLEDMIHHLKAVRKGVTRKPLMVDLPYRTYTDAAMGVRNAGIMRDKGADIVKLEGGKEIAETVQSIVEDGTPVMGHIGFQPQIAHVAKRAVVGALSDEALRLADDAASLEQAGVSAIVLECVPEDVTNVITERVGVATIGIGSGRYTDGQVLVIADVLGWYNMPFRFTRLYDRFHERTITAANGFAAEVRNGEYPRRNHAFRIKPEQFEAFRAGLNRAPGRLGIVTKKGATRRGDKGRRSSRSRRDAG
jgi:3-methyl-2-oxobutanoate hydroxymethyltransferase